MECIALETLDSLYDSIPVAVWAIELIEHGLICGRKQSIGSCYICLSSSSFICVTSSRVIGRLRLAYLGVILCQRLLSKDERASLNIGGGYHATTTDNVGSIGLLAWWLIHGEADVEFVLGFPADQRFISCMLAGARHQASTR